jgi:uncharacterized protein (DUF3084 family)
MNIAFILSALTFSISSATLVGVFMFARWLVEVRATREELRKVSSDIGQLRASVAKVSDQLRDMTSSTSIY